MGWRDRDYAHSERPGFSGSPLMWLLAGRVFLFRVWGVDVHAHASLIVVSVLVLLFGTPFGATVQDRMIFVLVLFGIILLHEFGHIFGARVSGGEANEIEMTPLGGLAMVMPGKGAWRNLVTVICGPAVNVVICLVAGAVLFWMVGYWPLGPFAFERTEDIRGLTPAWFNTAFYAYYIYTISYFLLLFNMLPVYPLDGGRTLQCLLWFKMTWYRSTLIATAVGIVGGIVMVMFGIARPSLLVALIGGFCGFNCWRMHRMLKAQGPWAFAEEDEPDWKRSLQMDPDEPDRPGLVARWRQRRQEAREQREQARASAMERQVDEILAKVSRSGMASLTGSERRILEEASRARRTR